MKKRFYSLTAAILALTLTACSASPAAVPNDKGSSAETSAAAQATNDNFADTVVYGDFYTAVPDAPQAEAVTIKDGKILSVGSREDAAEFVGDSTEVQDYGDSFLMPGFIDGHVHLYVDAENKAGDFILSECKSADAYLTAIKKAVADKPNAEMYRGFGWGDNMFIGGTPTAEMLDKICDTAPIYIKSEDCHSCWVNTKMMEICGITKEMENPLGGIIERDEDGNPNGCFRDTAMDLLIKPYVSPYSVEEYKEMLLKGQNFYTGWGYTAFDDVIIDPQEADEVCRAYSELDKEGKLLVKVNAALLVNNNKDYEKNIRHIKELADELNGDNFRITDVKFFMDGIVESKTASVSEPYVGTDYYGEDRWVGKKNTKRLYDAARLTNDLGLVAHFHALGDAAASKALDAIAYAKENSTNKDIRNCITHLQLIKDEDIQRMADLDVIAVADYGWSPSMSEEIGMENIELLNVGKERNDSMYPYASMFNKGVKVSYATDYPAGPVVFPLYNIQAGITRQILDYKTTSRNPKEGITAEQALYGITSGGAYQLQRENEIGSLEPGKDADFIMMNQNLLTVDPYTIYRGTEVEKVWIDGSVVYQAEEKNLP